MKKGIMVCTQCEGKGCFDADIEKGISARICSKCKGYGQVDWIENIVGKREYPYVGFDNTGISLCTFVDCSVV